MASDTKEMTGAYLSPPLPSIADPFPGIQGTLDGILDTLRGVGKRVENAWIFDASGRLLPTSARLHASILVFSVSVAATVTLTIGTFTYTFVVPTGDTRVIPLPISIDRGVDATLTTSAGTVTGYMIGNAD